MSTNKYLAIPAGSGVGLCIMKLNISTSHLFQYEAYVPENTVGAKVIDIGIIDKDAHGTPAWHATFEIIRGNEDGAFKIERNLNSNVGTLCIEKVNEDRKHTQTHTLTHKYKYFSVLSSLYLAK